MTTETKIFVVLRWIYAFITSMIRFVKLNILICGMKSL